MRKPRLSTAPPKIMPLVGRKSPAGSHNFAGVNKGFDAPNKTATAAANTSPFGAAPPAPGGLPTQDFCKGGKVLSTTKF